MKRSKYGAIKVKEDGITFDSKLEHRRYKELRLLQKSGLIEGLQVHPKFAAKVNDQLVCNILLDFQYYDKAVNRLVYEDTKGVQTPISRLKYKLLKALYLGIDVRLIYKTRSK